MADDATEQTEEAKAAQAFVAAGQARVAPILQNMNDLAARVGGVGGLQMNAMHGVLVAYTAALLNHIAGVADPDVEDPYTHNDKGERVAVDPATGDTAATETQAELAPLASTGPGESPAPEAAVVGQPELV